MALLAASRHTTSIAHAQKLFRFTQQGRSAPSSHVTPKAPPLPARQPPLQENPPADRKTSLSRGPERGRESLWAIEPVCGPHDCRWCISFVQTITSNLFPSFTWILSVVSHCSYRRMGRVLNAKGESLFFCISCSVSDLNPEVNYYWHHGKEVVVHGHRKGRVDPVRFQIDDSPHLQIRVPKQLPEVGITHKLNVSIPAFVPVIDHKPSKLPLFKKQYENKVFIGAKVADPCCYGHTQFHLLPDKLKRERFIRERLEDQIEVVYRSNGIASLFAWTAAQAMYQGFWNEADVTRPFVSQAVVTDGKYFAFFCYQLNTLALTAETIKNNPRKNICWGTDSKPLYDVVEDGNVKGFNDEVLLQLVHFLLNRPKEL
uniref:Mitochondrial ribosomal protein S30 n=1 Tax=Serinus canaria TaxID=9135 RepID=A0A8C9NU59_SERCA